MTDTITPKALATELGTDPKTVRKFLRSITEDRAGKGGRWVIEADKVEGLKRRFATWKSAKVTTLSVDFDDEVTDEDEVELED